MIQSQKEYSFELSPRFVDELLVRDDQFLAVARNESETEVSCSRMIGKDLVHFFFCLDASAMFEFSPHYARELTSGKNYFIYDPTRDFLFTLKLAPGCKLVLMSISLESLHKLFVHDPHEIAFLKTESASRKFYDEQDMSPNLYIVLNQLFKTQLTEPAQKLFYQGKILEILSFYFSKKRPDAESCPYLNDQEMVRKLKHAKDFLLQHIESPPTLKEIAKSAGLNEQQLKTGFKRVYGNTVYNYLLDHRLENARILLDSGRFHVKEVSFQIGYANTSHFIAAFRKKYGVTPKKYLMGKM